jgi:hypothetical protein
LRGEKRRELERALGIPMRVGRTIGRDVISQTVSLAKPQIEPIARTLLVNREVLERVTIPSRR